MEGTCLLDQFSVKRESYGADGLCLPDDPLILIHSFLHNQA